MFPNKDLGVYNLLTLDGPDMNPLRQLAYCCRPENAPGAKRVMCTNLDKLKECMLTELSNFVRTEPGHTACGLLTKIFGYCIACAQTCPQVKPTERFSEEEATRFKQDIQHALPVIDETLFNEMRTLDSESVVRFRTVRSGLEFLKDELVYAMEDTVTWRHLIDELLSSYFVREIDEDLEYWNEEGVLGGCTIPVDLRSLPISHDWWLEHERKVSQQTYGKETRKRHTSISKPSERVLPKTNQKKARNDFQTMKKQHGKVVARWQGGSKVVGFQYTAGTCKQHTVHNVHDRKVQKI